MPQGEIAPEPWGSAMKAVNAISVRTGEASMRALSQMSGVHATTINRIIYGNTGRRGADPETIKKLAVALERQPSEIAEWAGQVWAETTQTSWEPPEEVNLLDRRELKHVEDLIRLLANQRKTFSVEVDRKVKSELAAMNP